MLTHWSYVFLALTHRYLAHMCVMYIAFCAEHLRKPDREISIIKCGAMITPQRHLVFDTITSSKTCVNNHRVLYLSTHTDVQPRCTTSISLSHKTSSLKIKSCYDANFSARDDKVGIMTTLGVSVSSSYNHKHQQRDCMNSVMLDSRTRKLIKQTVDPRVN